MNNMKQIALAFQQYLGDNDNRYPQVADISAADFGVSPDDGSSPFFVTTPGPENNL